MVTERFVCEDRTSGAAPSGRDPPQTKNSNSGAGERGGRGNPRGSALAGRRQRRAPPATTPGPASAAGPPAPQPRPGKLCSTASPPARRHVRPRGASSRSLDLPAPGSGARRGERRAGDLSRATLEGAVALWTPAPKVLGPSPKPPARTHRAGAPNQARSAGDQS